VVAVGRAPLPAATAENIRPARRGHEMALAGGPPTGLHKHIGVQRLRCETCSVSTCHRDAFT
jgi:hypothetical protein